jgi:arylsulfatase A-like enzyme
MLAYLKEAGLAENTIVIYCSDQGFYLGEHGWFDKRWMYEESLRTPMLVRWPKVVKPGSRNNDIVSPIDFAETFCEIAGIEVPGDTHGRSLVSVLKGKTPPDWRKSFYYHYYEYPGWHYVRRHYGVADGRYKLIHFYEKDVDQWELFDLKSDLGEMKSVYGKPGMAKVQKRLSKQLAMHRKELEVPEEDPPHSIVKRLPPRLRKPTTPN